MSNLFNRTQLTTSLGVWVLSGWLIAMGAIPLLEINSSMLMTVVHVAAIAAGVLLILQR